MTDMNNLDTPEGVLPMEFIIDSRGKFRYKNDWIHFAITIKCQDFEDNAWSVNYRLQRLNSRGEWEYESYPSRRTDAFKKRTTFPFRVACELGVKEMEKVIKSMNPPEYQRSYA